MIKKSLREKNKRIWRRYRMGNRREKENMLGGDKEIHRVKHKNFKEKRK